MTADSSRNRMFPAGLYAVLLCGLFGVTFPELVAPVESTARSVACLPLRAYSILFAARPVLAAEDDRGLAAIDRRGASVLQGAAGPPGHTPRVCRVVSREDGPLDLCDELILHQSYAELSGCAALVTSGSALIGFLAPRPEGEDAGQLPARVRLLQFRRRRPKRGDDRLAFAPPFRPARVAARVACTGGTHLHFLVEPARAVDRWVLRCTLLDDAYLASQLRESGGLVTTHGAPEVPDGLHVGRLRIWGYPDLNIPVGLFVEPMRDARSISSVVVWEVADGTAEPPPAPAGTTVPVRLSRFPAPRPTGECWLITAGAGTALRDGAAVVDRGVLLGTLLEPWAGQSLVTPFASSSREWALILRTPGGAVHELVGRIRGPAEQGMLRLRILNGQALKGARGGELFTGANGRDCPTGFRIGTARVVPANQSPARGGLVGNGGAEREILLVLPERRIEAPAVFVGGRDEDAAKSGPGLVRGQAPLRQRGGGR